MKFPRLSTSLRLISLLAAGLLLPACSTLDAYHDVSMARPDVQHEGALGKQVTEYGGLPQTRGVTIAEAQEFARLLQLRYDAAIRGQAKDQEEVRLALTGLVAGAVGSVLFDSDHDVLKGLGLAGGALYTINQVAADNHRRGIYTRGIEALGCLVEAVDKSGLSTSRVQNAMSAVRAAQETRQAFRRALWELRDANAAQSAPIADMISRLQSELPVPESPESAQGWQQEVRQLAEVQRTVQKLLQTVKDSGNLWISDQQERNRDLEATVDGIESYAKILVTKTFHVQMAINQELSRLEPDQNRYLNELRGHLQGGFATSNGRDSMSGLSNPFGNVWKPDGTVLSLMETRNAMAKTLLALGELRVKALKNPVARGKMEGLERLSQAVAQVDGAFDRMVATQQELQFGTISFDTSSALFADCSLDVENGQVLRLMPPAVALELDSRAQGLVQKKVLVNGGRAPYLAVSDNDDLVVVERMEALGENKGWMTLKVAVNRGHTTNVTVVDNKGTPQVLNVMVPSAKANFTPIAPPTGLERERTAVQQGVAAVPVNDLNSCLTRSKQGYLQRSAGYYNSGWLIQDIRRLQRIADKAPGMGKDVTIDGLMGYKTWNAVCLLQDLYGERVTGKLSRPELARYEQRLEITADIVPGALSPFEFSPRFDVTLLKQFQSNLKEALGAEGAAIEPTGVLDAATRTGIERYRSRFIERSVDEAEDIAQRTREVYEDRHPTASFVSYPQRLTNLLFHKVIKSEKSQH
ncbi:hypothetical protein Mmc1_3125 [Magnetococcus marinus MC-1]|uniref:Peptidoglycan-binding domain 1 protein n=1 Tax=Magnetococcus marinus (strain ATCC BAA-1437 / JCM 17883 / MC-1) TaxID=156889 RepID=A0LCC2_MAGMM|nr:hypothetical protein [Magnetococcus marinus]ABK45615.1 hypothetical protein Mmc1_3125 [Magnetococcus marinus MC-1]